MLKRMTIKRILISSTALVALFLIYLIPNDNDYNLRDLKQRLEYVNTNVETAEIFLLNQNGLLTRTMVPVTEKGENIEARATEMLEFLKINSKNESKIPSGFKAYISEEAKINSIKYESGLLKVDVNEAFFDGKPEMEEKIIEGVTYTLTSIKGVEHIIIYINGTIVTKLPQTGIMLPSTLDRGIGINKEYHISSYKDVNKVTVYYTTTFNENVYYVPVTKYVNDSRDKISIIIEELSGSKSASTNLMSYLNSKTKLMSYNQADDVLNLVFNSYIFDDADKQSILEEVIYTISLSIADNYDVKEVAFMVEDKEIYKSVLKEIE